MTYGISMTYGAQASQKTIYVHSQTCIYTTSKTKYASKSRSTCIV